MVSVKNVIDQSDGSGDSPCQPVFPQNSGNLGNEAPSCTKALIEALGVSNTLSFLYIAKMVTRKGVAFTSSLALVPTYMQLDFESGIIVLRKK